MTVKAKRALSFLTVLSVMSVAGVLCGAASAQADEPIEKLTKENVEAFILKTTEISAGKDPSMDSAAVSGYLDRHLHQEGRFVSTMRFTFPGMPPQDTKLSLSKEEFIAGIAQGEKALDDYESMIEIQDIKIGSKKDKATVKTTGKEMGQLPTQLDTGEVQYVPVEGVSECVQILTLEEGVIKMQNANCLTTIDMLPY